MMVSLKTLLEKLGKDATAGDYVKDFRKSDAPQFKGKSKEKRHKMAIAAYLDAKDAEKNERISTVDVDQKKRDLKVARIDKKIKDLKSEGKAYGPTGIAYAVKSGHPDEVDPRTRKKYPERQTAKYKKQWAKNNKESVNFNEISAKIREGSGKPESWEAGYKRRVVRTTKPEHKEKGMNWRIKGKDRPEISIRLYKEKPSQAEFNKQMKRVAGHEFGG